MKKYAPANVRNVGLLSHGGAGKTSFGEACLFNAKVTTRLCSVDDENSNFDFEPEEIKRHASISTAFGTFEWGKTRITVIDTPGDSNFFHDTLGVIPVMDSALILVSAVDGVEVNTEKTWELSGQLDIPRAIFINKLDRERANWQKTLDEIREVLSPTVVPLSLPIGKEHGFKGVVDLISGKAFEYAADGSGKATVVDVPADLADQVTELREAFIEGVAESDEELMEKYFEAGELTPEEIAKGLRKGIIDGAFIPVFCGAASKNIGVDLVMNIIASSFPSPLDRKPWQGTKPDSEETVEIAPEVDAPFSGYVFKTVVDAYAGRLSIFRVMSGTIHSDGQVYNSVSETKERYGQIMLLQGKKQEAVTSASCGDIVAVAKLKDTTTGDSFCDESRLVQFAGLPVPNPVISYAIKPKTQGEEDKVGVGLNRLREEDPALILERSQASNQQLLSGMGQIHIEVALEKLKRKFGVEVDLSLPKVPYKETIKGKALNIEGKHKKQTGGRGQFGVCYIDMEANKDEHFEFVNNIVGGSIPKQYIPAVEKGIVESMDKGILAGYPVTGIRVRLFDGKFHAVDSSEMAFKIAGSLAFKAAMEKCKPALLEPIMEMEITVPEENMGDIMGDVSSRRGRVLGMEPKGRTQVIKAQVPMAEVLTYAPDINSMTSGRGTFTMTVSHYEEVPAAIIDKLLEELRAAQED